MKARKRPKLLRRLRGTDRPILTEGDKPDRPLTRDDILVVTPYNLQVRNTHGTVAWNSGGHSRQISRSGSCGGALFDVCKFG